MTSPQAGSRVATFSAVMSELIQPIQGLWRLYHLLDPGFRAAIYPLTFGVACIPIFYCLERLSGGGTTQYRSRGFLQDGAYWLWHTTGLYKLIFTSSVLALITPYLHVFQVNLLGSFPAPVRGVIYYMIAEFIAYWYHRWQHSNSFLWAFHTTHHSQRHLSFATFNRFHPVDEFLMDWLTFVPVTMLGASINDWLPLYYIHKLLVYAQHSQVSWRFGWLDRFFVTPLFHSVHHSSDPRHHNRNFGATISLWDHVFGTAVRMDRRPEEYGLDLYPTPTLLNTLIVPFQLAWKALSGPQPTPQDATRAPLASANSVGRDG